MFTGELGNARLWLRSHVSTYTLRNFFRQAFMFIKMTHVRFQIRQQKNLSNVIFWGYKSDWVCSRFHKESDNFLFIKRIRKMSKHIRRGTHSKPNRKLHNVSLRTRREICTHSQGTIMQRVSIHRNGKTLREDITVLDVPAPLRCRSRWPDKCRAHS